jgi:hypothetical protein
MNKLLHWYDTWFLKILVAFLIIFTVLYPKLPSVHIVRTWVYIRLEDFSILFASIIWFIQVLRKKVTVPLWLAGTIGLFWGIGLLSTAFSIVFIGPHLANYFPHLALLEDFRRVEYMILFFVAFSTIKNAKDIRDYFIVLCITVFGAVIYGFGQRYYLDFWSWFPRFFEQNPFCFPSFQTGNEEFAKGLPLCLPRGARITSTFGGHYDLAAYLVLVLPILFTGFIAIKKWFFKIVTFLLFVGGLILLIFTASRTSFAAYILGIIGALIFFKKKWFIIPVLIVSMIVLLMFSESTAKRFLETVRISSIVTNSQGQLVGETGSLPSSLENKISKNTVENPPPAQNLQAGSAFIGLPVQTTPVATSVAIVKKTISPEEARRLGLANGSLEIASVSGTFLVRKALVYDISFTTRFQAEWPNAWKAFLRNPLLGSGYSSITLATDNDFLRALGETGLLGFISFVLIFIVLGIALVELAPKSKDQLVNAWAFGAAGGLLGLAANATLIDVFESSKVAEGLWIMLGIGAGSLYLYKHKAIPYVAQLKRIFTSQAFLMIYFVCLTAAVFMASVNNFFIADDFTWLRWAASATAADLKGYFLHADNFFYRPLDKVVIFFLYNFFSFQPAGYHIFTILLHLLVVVGVYFLAKQIVQSKYLAFLSAAVFLLLPAHAEAIYWFSSISIVLSAVFIIYMMISFIHYRKTNAAVSYLLSFLLAVLAFVTYEISVIIPLLLVVIDVFIIKPKWKKTWTYIAYLPFALLIPGYYVIRQIAHAFSGGGDYSYSIPHLIPNFFGNIFGYIGLFIAGEPFLPIYDTVRIAMKTHVLLFVLISALLCAIIVIACMSSKHTLIKWLKNTEFQKVIGGFVLSLVALMPFLGLGNITERYLYLASASLSIVTVILLYKIIAKIAPHAKHYKNWILFVLISLLGVVSVIGLNQQAQDWQRASTITKNTLSFFRIKYEQFPPATNLYFVNVPMKVQSAWVFPVGLADGIWFIYQNNSLRVHQEGSLEQAQMDIQQTSTTNNFIFSFDKEGKIRQVE